MGQAILSVHNSVLEEIFFLPEGYSIAGATYNEQHECVDFLLSSTKLPYDSHALRVQLHLTQNTIANYPEYRRITGEIKLP